MIELTNYIDDPNSDLNNFNLGLYYENMKHYSPASGFYLRCAEKTNNIDLRYEALLRIYICYKSLGSRDHSCESILKQALCLCSERPEAYYFLCEYYENKVDWLNMYTYSCLGSKYTNNKSNFLSEISTNIEYSFLLKRAISSWKYGKPEECRFIMKNLMQNYLDIMTEKDKLTLKQNLMSYGLMSHKTAIQKYDKSMINNLKINFNNLNTIENNYSQIYQDIFVLTALNGKTNGTYLEIGSSDPTHNNNTALLEYQFGWKGIGIEFNESSVKKYKEKRKNPVVLCDALIINYKKLLEKYLPNEKIVDYLQIDIDPCENSYDVLLSIPFDHYKFAVITYEHDYYIDITRSYRDKSREYLSNLGYILIAPNISPNDDCPFEDWWIHPDLVDLSRLDYLKNNNQINCAQKLLFK